MASSPERFGNSNLKVLEYFIADVSFQDITTLICKCQYGGVAVSYTTE